MARVVSQNKNITNLLKQTKIKNKQIKYDMTPTQL